MFSVPFLRPLGVWYAIFPEIDYLAGILFYEGELLKSQCAGSRILFGAQATILRRT
jgi:hypothetical protein